MFSGDSHPAAGAPRVMQTTPTGAGHQAAVPDQHWPRTGPGNWHAGPQCLALEAGLTDNLSSKGV